MGKQRQGVDGGVMESNLLKIVGGGILKHMIA
jgi:hypothetical protein